MTATYQSEDGNKNIQTVGGSELHANLRSGKAKTHKIWDFTSPGINNHHKTRTYD
ncbi:MAG: hypothetical protein L3J46_08605 [Kangiellaceae bacterium]|nr:hypothetical protein [Kangiellaceae bacterium]